jgi:L-lactate dehydrogenase (cytochrome)
MDQTSRGGVVGRVRRPLDTLRSVLRFRPLELDATARRLARAASVDDLRRIAKRRLPHGVFDYIDGAAEDELALANNTQAYRRITFRPRVLRDVSRVDPSTMLLGKPIPIPLVLAPTGFGRIADPQGELAVARAAGRAGLPYTLSTLGTRSIEEIGRVDVERKFFQVYVWRDRAMVKDMLDRAKAAGFEAIMVTVDTAVLGKRDRDVRRGFSLPPKIGLDTLVDGAIHTRWTLDFVRSEPIMFSNMVGSNAGDGSDAVSLADYINSQFDPALSWPDIDWLRTVWDGPIVIKGIQTVEDAVLAADAGVEAIALSNHGGRQLDSAPATVDLVAPVVDAVGGRLDVICDGGVRRGADIVKAVALGATCCMAGRAYLYALGAGGERGVDHVLGLLDADVRRTMALLGATSTAELNRDLVTWTPTGGPS